MPNTLIDVAIIGGGPGGSMLGSLLAKKGIKTVLFEKETFPRFRIGESLLPCSMALLKEIGIFDSINSGKYIQKFGACFIDHKTNERIRFNFEDNPNPDQRMAFEVPRGEFDSDLLDHAKKLGVEVRQPERVESITEHDDFIQVKTDQGEYRTRFLADASGRIAFLGNQKKMRQPNNDLINNIAVFSHYEGVKREAGKQAGDIIISVLPNQAWSWVIPFQGSKTSVGFVTHTRHLPHRDDFEGFMQNSIGSSPLFTDLMKDSKRLLEIQAISNYSHTCESMVGPRWIQIGDAAAFLDPIFSSGVHVSMTSGKFASELIHQALNETRLLNEPDLGGHYESQIRKGVRRFHHLIRLFYDTDFVKDMKKLLLLENSRIAFTSAVAGDAWNDNNMLFKMAGK